MTTIAVKDEILTEVRAKHDKQDISKLFGKLQFQDKVAKHKLARAWANRNIEHGEVFANTLELDFIIFQQNLFVEDSAELSSKLSRIGFAEQVGFPDEELFNSFSRVMYNKKHNIAVSLYPSKNKDAISTAYKIVENSIVDGHTGLAVFLASVKVLLTK